MNLFCTIETHSTAVFRDFHTIAASVPIRTSFYDSGLNNALPVFEDSESKGRSVRLHNFLAQRSNYDRRPTWQIEQCPAKN
jgi:hypothetical protein